MTARLRLDLGTESGSGRLTVAHVERLLAALEGDGGLVTLDGDVDAFCAGLDLDEIVRHDGDAVHGLERYGALLTAIGSTPRPVVALVDGPAIGGGVGIAAAADLVLATNEATFGLPETLFGLVPAVVFPVLARRVGPANARRLAMGAATISADEAWRLGLVDEIVADLDAAVARFAQRLQRLDQRAVAAVKSLSGLYESARGDYRVHASTAFAELVASAETRDRVRRFLAGETPWPDGGEA